MNYWLFQASPKEDDLRVFLEKYKKKFTWRASRYKDPRGKMCKGDGVVMYQTRGNRPEAAGMYALGKLTGKIIGEIGSWEAEVVLDQTRPLDSPISPDLMRSIPELKELLVLRPKGFMGCVFRLEPTQWAAILDLWNSKDASPEPVPTITFSSVERFLKESTPIGPSDPYLMLQQERKLVEEYATHAEKRGHRFEVARMSFADTPGHIRCDLYDQSRKLLIEAKSAPTRENVRMAIGELADYGRFLAVKNRAVLLPERPSKDLEKLLQTQEIGLVWRNADQSFSDNARGKLS